MAQFNGLMLVASWMATYGLRGVSLRGSMSAESIRRGLGNASVGAHVVTWVVDPNNQYNDPNLDNNVMQYSFVVGEGRGDYDFSISAQGRGKFIN